MEENLNKIFDELQEQAYNVEYHTYDYKLANQIIRKHFEKLVGQIEPLVMPKAETEKMILYKEVLMDLIEYAELERDREQSYVVVELFKNRFKKEPTLIKHVWDISNKIGGIIYNLR